MRSNSILFFVLIIGCSSPQKGTLESILDNGSSAFKEVLENPKHEVQIIYGKLFRDSIQHFIYNVDTTKFFYPASTVKMPVAFAAMQKLSENAWHFDSRLFIDSSEHNPRRMAYDSLFDQPYNVKNLVTKIFSFSDNQAHNILFGWLGKDYINELHIGAGLSSSRIVHQLSESAFSFSDESNANTFQVQLKDGNISSQFESRPTSFQPLMNPTGQLRGKGYTDGEGILVSEPFDFSQKNFFNLPDLLGSLERVIRPGFFPEEQRYKISPRMLRELEVIMKRRPNELPAPLDTLPDNYVKFFLYGDSKEPSYPEHISIRNKVGWAYGYLTDVAFIEDSKENVKFFLAATIHVNENEIYNDGNYEYESVGLPFLAELGRLVHAYEVKEKSSK